MDIFFMYVKADLVPSSGRERASERERESLSPNCVPSWPSRARLDGFRACVANFLSLFCRIFSPTIVPRINHYFSIRTLLLSTTNQPLALVSKHTPPTKIISPENKNRDVRLVRESTNLDELFSVFRGRCACTQAQRAVYINGWLRGREKGCADILVTVSLLLDVRWWCSR